MDIEQAKKILRITDPKPNGSVCGGSQFIAWSPDDRDTICLDGHFTTEQLETLIWWIKHYEGE